MDTKENNSIENRFDLISEVSASSTESLIREIALENIKEGKETIGL